MIPSSRARITAIARVVLQSWRNTLWSAFGRSRAVATLAAVVTVVCIGFYEYVAAAFAVPLFSALAARPGGLDFALNSVTAGMVVTSSLLLGMLSLASPSATLVDRLMASLPIRDHERHLGYLAPMMAVTFIGLVTVHGFAVWALAAAEPWFGWRLVLLLALISAQLAFALLLVELLILAGGALLSRVWSLPDQAARPAAVLLAGFAIVSVYIATASRAIHMYQVGHAFDTQASPLSLAGVLLGASGHLPSGPWAHPAGDVLIGVGAVALLAAMSWAIVRLSRLLVRADLPPRRPLFRTLVHARTRFGALLTLSYRSAARDPENRLYAVVSVSLAGLGVLAGVAFFHDTAAWAGLGSMLAVAASTGFAITSYGRMQAQRWLVASAPVRRAEWLAAIVAGALLHGLWIASLTLVPIIIAGWRPSGFGELVSLGCLFVLGTLWMLAFGTLLPASHDAPMCSALSAALSVVAALPVMYTLVRIGCLSSPVRTVVATVAIGWLCWGIVFVADERRHGGAAT